MTIKFRLFQYRYYLTIRPKRNYCGAQRECLASRPGEDWLRGRDLRDGKLWSLPAVLGDILASEFRLGRWAIR